MEATNNTLQTSVHDIAIIGLSGRFPEAENPTQFWKNLLAGKESVRPFPHSRLEELQAILGEMPDRDYLRAGYLDRITTFDPEYFQISHEEARYIDPQQRLMLELVEEAVQDAGYTSSALYSRTVGVFVAASKNVYAERTDSKMALSLVNSYEAAMSGRIAYTFDFCGPTLTIDTTCSSSLVALHTACQSIRNGECELAIAGGAKLNLFPHDESFLERSPISSRQQRVKAFDQDADGTVGGEGGAVVLLKSLEAALADGDAIHAVIKGSAVNSSGRLSNGLGAPNQAAQAKVIRKAIEAANIDPTTIGYLETHGTGTILGDPIEVEGIIQAFTERTDRKQFLPIGALKTNIGHLDSASGIAGVVKVILMLKHRIIPASLHFETPNPHIDFKNSPVYVNSEAREWTSYGVLRAGISSIGLTGTNAHMIFEEAPQVVEQQAQTTNAQLLTFSAKHITSLTSNLNRMYDYLEYSDGLALTDISYTLNAGRPDFAERVAIVATSVEQFRAQLGAIRQGLEHTPGISYGRVEKEKQKTRSTVFLLADFADGWQADRADLLQEPLFRHQYQAGVELCQGNLTPNVQYVVYLYARAKWLQAIGVVPQAVLGIGLGKLVADVLLQKQSLQAMIKQAREQQPNAQPVPDDKLQAVLQKMVSDGHNQFVTFAAEATLGKQVQRLLSNLPQVTACYFDLHSDTQAESLAHLYCNGVNFDWEALYEGQQRRRVHLHPYAFMRQSYSLPIKVQHISHTANDNHSATQSTPSVEQHATFAELLQLVQESIAEELDLAQSYEDNGGDSLTALQIAALIQQRYGYEVTMELLEDEIPLQEVIEKILREMREVGIPTA